MAAVVTRLEAGAVRNRRPDAGLTPRLVVLGTAAAPRGRGLPVLPGVVFSDGDGDGVLALGGRAVSDLFPTAGPGPPACLAGDDEFSVPALSA
ncbi:hypothetical protein MycrhDRAFT_5386 [Mycolicibacterium rhodesiae JS60]|nr:hypothetical protein MycrhDRAFT_5386 [Mycolicibacterium rhodesiae JS60]